MSNFKKPDQKAISALLNLAAAKLGTSPEALEGQLKSGNLNGALGGLPADQQQKLRAALSEPSAAQKIMNSPQARAIMEKLNKKQH